MREKLVSLIDDDEIFQFASKIAIERKMNEVGLLAFGDGEEAINYLKSHYSDVQMIPDIIFLDINMPYLDGWGFLGEFKTIKGQIKKEVIIYMMTSSLDGKDMEKAKLFSELSGYVVKPVEPDLFYKLIENSPSENWLYQ